MFVVIYCIIFSTYICPRRVKSDERELFQLVFYCVLFTSALANLALFLIYTTRVSYLRYTEADTSVILGEHHLLHQSANEITRKAKHIVKVTSDISEH